MEGLGYELARRIRSAKTIRASGKAFQANGANAGMETRPAQGDPNRDLLCRLWKYSHEAREDLRIEGILEV
jgi:hypothetical protein